MQITTIHGPMDEALLLKKEGGFEDANEKTSWVEYYYNNQLVHRSASIALKKGLETTLEQGFFS